MSRTWLYSYDEYMKEVFRVYKNERVENCYYFLIKDILLTFCSDKANVVNVSVNRQSKLHDRKIYADKGELQDLIIVPSEYTYVQPMRPFVSVEIKEPDIDINFGRGINRAEITRYNPLKWKTKEGDLKSQLKTQFGKTKYIIYTDCISWWFLEREDEDDDTKVFLREPKLFQLIEASGQDWRILQSNSTVWKNMGDYIRSFIERSQRDYK